MKSVGRTCLLWAILYFVCAGAAGALIYERFPQQRAAAIGGGIAGFFIWIALANVMGARTKGVEARQLRRAIEGGSPKDGEHVAVAGVVTGSMEFLESPITRTRCVAYEYKATPPDNQQLGAWQGLALAPTSINGPSGVVRILAAPELDFPGDDIGSHEHMRNFREYVAKTTWVDHRGVDFKRDLSHLREVNADDDGRIRDDVRAMDRDDPENMTLTEKTLTPGDRVVAFGLYSSARGGLVPDASSSITRPVKIKKGAPEELLRKARRGGPLDVLRGCGCLLPVLIAAIIGIIAVPLTAIEEMFPQKDPSWTEVRIEKKVRDEVTKAGLMPDSSNAVMQLARGAARGKITWHNKTSHFDRTAATRSGDEFTVTITGPDTGTITARFRNDGSLISLFLGDVSVPPEQVQVEQMYVGADEILGRITYLTPKNEPSLRVAFHG